MLSEQVIEKTYFDSDYFSEKWTEVVVIWVKMSKNGQKQAKNIQLFNKEMVAYHFY